MSEDENKPEPEIIEYQGKQARRLSNGTLQEISTGFFLTPPDDEHKPITQATASSIAGYRWQQAREKLISGAARSLGVAGPLEVVEELGFRAGEVAKQPGNSRVIEALRFISEKSGLLPRDEGETDTRPAVRLEISGEVASRLMFLLSGLRPDDEGGGPIGGFPILERGHDE